MARTSVGSITSATSAMPTTPMRLSFGRAAELGVRFQARTYDPSDPR
jgi:hypothetical protein